MPKGRPVVVLIGSDSGRVFADMRQTFGNRIRFIKLDWSSKAGEDAAKEFSVEKPPAVVLADSKGRVIEKIEGTPSSAEMRAKLTALAKGR